MRVPSLLSAGPAPVRLLKRACRLLPQAFRARGLAAEDAPPAAPPGAGPVLSLRPVFRRALRCPAALLAVLLLPSCEMIPPAGDTGAAAPPFPYLGGIAPQAAPAGQSWNVTAPARNGGQVPVRIEVYNSFAEIRQLHRVTGEIRMMTDGRTSPHAIRSFFENEAHSHGAEGVIIQDPADRPDGTPGPGFDKQREILGTFIRYDAGRL